MEQRIEKLEKREFHSKSDLLTDKKKLNAYRTFAPGDKLDCLAIFNPIDPEADDIKIFVHGLVDDIRIDEMPGGGFRVTERVLELTYERPGDEFYTSLDAFEFKGSKWTKRVIETSSD